MTPTELDALTDEEYAKSLAERFAGHSGETWFLTGYEQAILVAMRRARAKAYQEASQLCTRCALTDREGINDILGAVERSSLGASANAHAHDALAIEQLIKKLTDV